MAQEQEHDMLLQAPLEPTQDEDSIMKGYEDDGEALQTSQTAVFDEMDTKTGKDATGLGLNQDLLFEEVHLGGSQPPDHDVTLAASYNDAFDDGVAAGGLIGSEFANGDLQDLEDQLSKDSYDFHVSPQMHACVQQQEIRANSVPDIDAFMAATDEAFDKELIEPLADELLASMTLGRKRMAPAWSPSDGADESDMETAAALSPPQTPASPPGSPDSAQQTPASVSVPMRAAIPMTRRHNVPRPTRESQLTVQQTIIVYSTLAHQVDNTVRRERNFADMYRKLSDAYKWMQTTFTDISLFKQKIKLYLQERRTRQNLNFWRKLTANQGDPKRTLSFLKSEFSQTLIPESIDLGPIAEYLAHLVVKKAKSPGCINDWDADARKAMIDLLVAVHQEEGVGAFTLAHGAVSGLITLGAVEMTIVSNCTCKTCASWNVPSGKQTHETILAWTKTRMSIMRDVLKAHVEAAERGTWSTFKTLAHRIPQVENWSVDRLNNFVQSVHNTESCEFCAPARKVRRKRSGTDADDEDDCCSVSSSSSSSPSCSDDEEGECENANADTSFVPIPSGKDLELLAWEEADIPLQLQFEDEEDEIAVGAAGLPTLSEIASLTDGIAKVTV
ncbi:Hypothetical Protein FCC1311_067312 [Hondaea fermentalgiana]|uniref:Uncharacterized protein n=1 Tax=Hondaea fermentalgiana TaxID=2315210 RepID=A0A2R5GQ82_9STRA|nr:Hypothetical Protein FCC1311_067312 [Hondaea fermentalgiana]|eukprot:GBG30511.1 Hypothetical Protein FCC1311_067312 [Hondaea fermentalgiana]